MKLVKTFFFALLALIPHPVWAQETTMAAVDSFRLMPQVQVDSSGVFLDQLVIFSGTNRVIPHTFLARAPRLDQTVSFSRNDVAVLSRAFRSVTSLVGRYAQSC